jgi:hypothetical protein
MARNTYVREECISLSGKVGKTCRINADIGYGICDYWENKQT